MLKLKNLFYMIVITAFISSCNGIHGFYEPLGMDLEVPDGPREFKAGWHDGCQSALSVAKHYNGRTYPAAFGNGIYQHDSTYIMAWGRAWYTCYNHGGTANSRNAFKRAPFD